MTDPIRFTRDTTALAVIDIQEKLAPKMSDIDRVLKNAGKLVTAFRALSMPVLLTEQYPAGLGRTVHGLAETLEKTDPVEKNCFSCCGDPVFIKRLDETGKTHLLLTGIETHICVMQTALDLCARGVIVGVVRDAVSSYNRADSDTALARMRESGVVIVTTEMIVYELLEKAGTPEFKDLLPIMKDRDRD